MDFLFLPDFKGIVSRDFVVCFLVPLDSSDIATLPEQVRFKKKLILYRIFYFSGLGAGSFCRARISAQGTNLGSGHFGGSFRSPGQGTTKDWVKIGLQRNNKYSFDSVRPGLTLKFW
jgi:hypothetical protein